MKTQAKFKIKGSYYLLNIEIFSLSPKGERTLHQFPQTVNSNHCDGQGADPEAEVIEKTGS
jgi:hypothetical protein